MQHTYFVHTSAVTIAIADLSEIEDGVWEVNRLNVPRHQQGMGYGKRLIQRVCKAADDEGVTLRLNVNPYGSLDRDALVAWYERYGFVVEEDPERTGFEMERASR